MAVNWDLDFISSKRGAILVLQVILAILGAIVNSYSNGYAVGLLNFCFWSTVFLSTTLYFIHVCNCIAAITATISFCFALEYAYVGLWTIMYIVASVLSFFQFEINAIFCYIVLVLYITDLFFLYQSYKNDSTPNIRAPPPGSTGEMA